MSGSERSNEEWAAALVAKCIINAAATFGQHRRLYLAECFGLTPHEVYSSLQEHLVDAVPPIIVTAADGSTHTLRAVDLQVTAGQGGLLVPYLVETGRTDPNVGTAGFAAFLRDALPTEHEGRSTVLIVLHHNPVETVKTAAQDAGELDGLSWRRLLELSVIGSSDEVKQLLDVAVELAGDRLPQTATTLGRLHQLATERDAALVGTALHLLGPFVSDPHAISNPRPRLKDSMKWRQDLDNWSSPDEDLDARLRPRYESDDDPRLARIRAARGPFGLDYAAFNYDDLPTFGGHVQPARLAHPLRVRGAAAATRQDRAAAWIPGGGRLGLALATAASRRETATLRWSDGSLAEIEVEPGDVEVSFQVVAPGWRYAVLQLSGGQSAALAISTDTGSWTPVEVDLDIDFEVGAFRCEEEPQIVALAESSAILGQAVVQSTPDADGERHEVRARFGGAEARIHLLVTPRMPDGNDDPSDGEPTPEPDAPDPDEGAADDEQQVPGPGNKPAPPERYVPTGAHAIIYGSRDGSPTDVSDFFIPENGEAFFPPHSYRLQRQDLGDELDGLALERAILAAPDTLAFTVSRTAGGDTELEPHPYLSSLDLGALPDVAYQGFKEARSSLFAALFADAHRSSIHAIAAGICLDEAEQYVGAYRSLLAELAAQPRFRAEFEAVLLVDTVSDRETGSWWIAPTSPLTVAHLLELTRHARIWSRDAADLLDDDLRTCTPRHLLPNFFSDGTWYQTADSPVFLWRRYGPMNSSDPAESRPSYIAKRIRRFLDVHRAYKEERQELAVAFVEPGEGRGPLEALRLLLRPLTTPGAKAVLPQLTVTIASSSDRPTVLEDVLRGNRSLASELDRALRDRVKLRRVSSSAELGFQHITFAFQSSLQEEPGSVELDSRATTLFVNGLAALPGRAAEVDPNETAFRWGTFAGPATGRALGHITRSGLELVGGMPRAPLAAGRTRMPTARVGHRFLEPLYASSAWVVHLDRLLGLEAFAPDAKGSQARYLIDFEERSDPGQPGLDAITATARINPYRLALRRALARLGTTPQEPALDRMLQLYNGVSGKWALDLVGDSGHGLQEKVGLAATLAAVRDLDGWLSEDGCVGVIIPLDELIDSLPAGARPRDGQRCDDLLYLRLPLGTAAGTRQPVQARLLEVKYRKVGDTASAESARRQLERSFEWLREIFAKEGPSRLFRARDLAELLRGAVTRASSFGLLTEVPLAGFETALGRIISGDYDFELGYDVGGRRLNGDFVSIEPSSATAVHRQDLPGTGLQLGHIRLGAAVIESLASGEVITRPPGWAVPEFGHVMPPEQLAADPDAGDSALPGPDGGGREVSVEPAKPQPTGNGQANVPELALTAGRLDAAFAKYGLDVEPFMPGLAQVGPSVIRFRTKTLGRLSIAEVERRARDIGREISAPGEVQVSDEPGFVTIDVPRAVRGALTLADVVPALDATTSKPGALDFVVGVAPSGEIRIADLSRLPHLLVAGATGSGKSVFLRGLLTELLRARTPGQLQILIVDPKRLDFIAFTRAPHLRGGAIISDPDQAVETLKFTLDAEISLRQPLLEAAGVSSASEFYEAGGRLEDLPQLVILVDEFADLVLAGTDPRAFLDLIQRYAQLTRAYGIYLVLATQRPSVNVITGSIKTNLAARIAFSLPSARDSMTVIDKGGAENLLGDGDLLFYRSGRVERLQAPFTSLQDVRGVLP